MVEKNILMTAKNVGKYFLSQNGVIAIRISVTNLSTAPNEMIS